MLALRNPTTSSANEGEISRTRAANETITVTTTNGAVPNTGTVVSGTGTVSIGD